MKFAIIGATGNVGRKTIDILEKSKLDIEQLHLVASKNSLGTLAIPYILANCGNFNNLIAAPSKLNQNVLNDLKDFTINSLQATASDNLELAEGLSYDVLIKWNDKISKREI